jgi:hypothetical protein
MTRRVCHEVPPSWVEPFGVPVEAGERDGHALFAAAPEPVQKPDLLALVQAIEDRPRLALGSRIGGGSKILFFWGRRWRIVQSSPTHVTPKGAGWGRESHRRDGELGRRLVRGRRGGQSFDPFRPLARVSIPLFKPSEQGRASSFWGPRWRIVQPGRLRRYHGWGLTARALRRSAVIPPGPPFDKGD